METNARQHEKVGCNASEQSHSATIHVVCRQCGKLEELVRSRGVAGILAREHEATTGHDVVSEEICG